MRERKPIAAPCTLKPVANNVTCVTSGGTQNPYDCSLKREDYTMNISKTELANKDRRAEGSYDSLKTELSEEDLSRVSGGRNGLFTACVTGKHINSGKITM